MPSGDDEDNIEAVYRGRNVTAIALLAALAEREHYKEHGQVDMGWWNDSETSDEWSIVWVDLFTGDKPYSSVREYGQVGWHVPSALVPGWLEEKDPEYDGYTDEEKLDRLMRYCGLIEHDDTPKDRPIHEV